MEPNKRQKPINMNFISTTGIFELINGIDPSLFFVISIVPYIAFLYWAQKGNLIPSLSLMGFRLTLLFVLMTIVFAIIARVFYGEELTNIDPLHGAAESFLALSDALIVIGFYGLMKEKEVKNS